jgi:hypothetical protein
VPTIEPVPRGIGVALRARRAAAAFYKRMREFTTNLDRWFVYDFLLPATLLMHSGGAPPAAPRTSARQTCRRCTAQLPDADARDRAQHALLLPAVGAAPTRAHEPGRHRLRQPAEQAFEEDRAMITAQARTIAMKPDAPMLPLAMDSALIQFRRIVDEARRSGLKDCVGRDGNFRPFADVRSWPLSCLVRASRQALPAGGSCCGGRRCAPTPLRCSRQGRAAELTALPAVAAFEQPRQVSSRSALARADPGAALLVATEIAPRGQRLPRSPPVVRLASQATAGSAKARPGRWRRASEVPRR